jgi:hypothetical protein
VRQVADEAIAAGAFAPEGDMTLVPSAESDEDARPRRRSSQGASSSMSGYPFHKGLSRGEPGEQASGTDEDSEAGSKRSWTSKSEADVGTRRSRATRSEDDTVRRSVRGPRGQRNAK